MNLLIAYYRTPSHSGEEADDIKILGLFSTRERAEQAVRSASTQPGFVKALGNFHILQWPLDEKQWVNGPVTWAEAFNALERSKD